MKKIVLFILAMLLCTVLLVGCGETPPDNRPVDERIKVGMTREEVVKIMGSDGTMSNISPNIFIWNTGEEKDLYVFFNDALYTSNASSTVARIERRKDLTPTVGMTLTELNLLLCRGGVRINNAASIYTWDYRESASFYAWFDQNLKLVRYTYSNLPEIKNGMSYEEVTDFFLREGAPVANVPELYSWDTIKKDRYYYVRFENGKVNEFFEDGPITIAEGMSYYRISKIFNTHGKKLSNNYPVYSWPLSEDTVGIFKFYDNGKQLNLTSFTAVSNDLETGATLEDFDTIIGECGTRVPNTPDVYGWRLDGNDMYLYARIADGRVSEIIDVGNIAIEPGITYDRMTEIYGVDGTIVNSAQNLYSWKTSEKTTGIFKFEKEQNKMVLTRFDIISNGARFGMFFQEFDAKMGGGGTRVPNVPNLYMWPSSDGNGYLYVRFHYGEAHNFVDIDDEIKIEAGISYNRMTDIYGQQGTKVSRWEIIYSWPTSENSIGIFRFEKGMNGELTLTEFDTNINKFTVGLTLDQLYGNLGVSGVNTGITTTTVYKWKTSLDVNLYVWFDSNMVARQISFEKNIAIKYGLTADDLQFILGKPTYRRHLADRWTTTSDTDLYVVYNEYNLTVKTFYHIPKLDVYNGMSMQYVTALMDKEAEYTFENGDVWYVWTIGETGFEMFVAFNEDGAYDIGFRLIGSNLI